MTFDPSKIDRNDSRYARNMVALGTVVARLWRGGIHGDDAQGWVDIEFKDLATAASFAGVLCVESQAHAIVRNLSGIRTFPIFGKAVVLSFPVPSDRDVFSRP